ncbi:MAG: hypothetical protein LKF99_01020 [Bifidobacterium sp.]|nr:hypothetical protein [Bifidobacterium sp.]
MSDSTASAITAVTATSTILQRKLASETLPSVPLTAITFLAFDMAIVKRESSRMRRTSFVRRC